MLWIPYVNNLLDGDLYILSHRQRWRHKIFNANVILYYILVLILLSKFMKNVGRLVLLSVFNTIQWWFLIMAYFFGPLCGYFVIGRPIGWERMGLMMLTHQQKKICWPLSRVDYIEGSLVTQVASFTKVYPKSVLTTGWPKKVSHYQVIKPSY